MVAHKILGDPLRFPYLLQKEIGHEETHFMGSNSGAFFDSSQLLDKLISKGLKKVAPNGVTDHHQ